MPRGRKGRATAAPEKIRRGRKPKVERREQPASTTSGRPGTRTFERVITDTVGLALRSDTPVKTGDQVHVEVANGEKFDLVVRHTLKRTAGDFAVFAFL